MYKWQWFSNSTINESHMVVVVVGGGGGGMGHLPPPRLLPPPTPAEWDFFPVSLEAKTFLGGGACQLTPPQHKALAPL